MRLLPLLALACADGAAKNDRVPGTDLGGTGATTDDASTHTTTASTSTDCSADAPDPGPPTPGDLVGTVTVTVKTGPDLFDGTDDTTLSLCLTADRCFPLSNTGGTQTADGELGVWQLDGGGLTRAELDRVELRETDGGNHWEPTCVDVRLDGVPVHCADGLSVQMGNSGDETLDWTDPDGVHEACGSCWGAPVTHGPMLGEIRPDRVRIWVRTDATRAVRVRVGTQPDLADARVAAWAYPRAEDDFAAELAVGCLAPDTAYYYAIDVDGAQVGEGHAFHTPPADGAATTLDLAFGSCARFEAQPIFTTIHASEPDLFALIGDSHYGDTTDRERLRWWDRWALSRPDRAFLLNHTPTVAIWDDHDFGGNDVDGTIPGADTSLAAFRAYWAQPEGGTAGADGIFFHTTYGDVDLFFLDGRYQRRKGVTLLGDGQDQWLIDALHASTATFKLVFSGSGWSAGKESDSWASYTPERDAIFAAIADVPGVVLLSGDVHRGELREIGRANGYALPEIVSSPLANLNTPCLGDDALACVTGTDLFGLVTVDTTAADPTVTAVLIGEDNVERARHAWSLSELQ